MILYADSIGDIEVIKTGLFIDKLSGVGGVPRGVITEIFGDEGIGKTSLAFQIVVAAQKQGLKVLWADVEWSYIPKYAEFLGVDNSKVGIIRERFAEGTLNILEEEINTGKWDLVILDSVGGLNSRGEAEKEAGEKTIGSQAGLVSKFCRKVVPALSIHKTALIVLNHSFVDIMSSKLLTSGGKKLAYHKSLSVRLKAKFGGTALKKGDRKVGKMVVGEVKKNKLAATEGLEIEGQLIFGVGFSVAADLLGDAIEKGVITKRGSTYYLGDEKLGVGLSNVRKMMEDDAVLSDKIKHETSKTA